MKKKLMTLIIAFLLLSACGGITVKESSDQKIMFTTQPFMLDEPEIVSLGKSALLGSPTDAFRLYEHYNLVEIDLAKTRFWVQIAAENGHVVAQYNYAHLLLAEGGPAGQNRGVYWLKQAARNGDSDARNELEEMNTKTP